MQAIVRFVLNNQNNLKTKKGWDFEAVKWPMHTARIDDTEFESPTLLVEANLI